MRRFAALPVLAPAIALAACAPTAAQTAANDQRAVTEETRLATALAGLTPGKTYTCLPEVARTQVQSQGYGKTILYRVNRNLMYRSETAGGCEGLSRGDILVTRQYTGRSCAGDIITTVDPVARFITGSCSFGPFTEYRKPGRS